MTNALGPIQNVAPVPPLELAPLQPPPSGAPGDFRGVLDSALASVEKSQRTAAQAVESFLSGSGGELHSTILATQRAEMQLQLFLQVRNKLLSCYQEVMRAQV